MISALSWVPKGATKIETVVGVPPTKEEIEDVLRTGTLEIEGDEDEEDDDMHVDNSPKEMDEVALARAAAKALRQPKVGMDAISNSLVELNMDAYDDEDDGIDVFGSGVGDCYYRSNEMDPYLQKHGDDDEYSDEDEAEDMAIKTTDSVIVCARNEDEFNYLEFWIFEDSEDGDSNMYVHHEIILPAFPLCTAWLDCNLKDGDKGNFLAVGSMQPAIEIWDLDNIDEVQPFLVLGGVSRIKKKEEKKTAVYRKDSHRDSVLGLAWNKEVRNVLASASADKSVKIWDVVTGKCVSSSKHHTDKVQSVAWNMHSPELLLSGSFDKSILMVDGRSINEISNQWRITSDVESLAWDPHANHSFVVSLENGIVQGFDDRTVTPVFTLHAHEKPVSSISYNPRTPNLLATGSTDRMVKLWNLSNNQPSCVASNNPKAGRIFSLAFSEDNPNLLAVGGHRGKLKVWDIASEPGIARNFETGTNPESVPMPEA